MTDIKLPPLPEHFAHQSERVQEHVRVYAREAVRMNATADRPELVAVAWVAADTLHSPHPTCVSSLAYMSQLDKDRGREYVPLYAAPVSAQKEDDALDAERYRWLRKGANDDIAVVRGLGATDYGMSAVVYTYSEEIDGDELDAAIDATMRKEGRGDD